MRTEFKYLISESEAQTVESLLNTLGVRDKHNSNGAYHVRSLYFDSFNLSAFHEKMEGLYSREKFRVRFLKGAVRLEKKCKRGLLGFKERFSKGAKLNGVAVDFKSKIKSKELIPIIYISYDRLAFIVGDCRVTIDRNIVAEAGSLKRDVRPGFCILEVKFINNRMPRVIYDAICKYNFKRIAFSKYCEGVVVIYGENPIRVVPGRFCINTLF